MYFETRYVELLLVCVSINAFIPHSLYHYNSSDTKYKIFAMAETERVITIAQQISWFHRGDAIALFRGGSRGRVI